MILNVTSLILNIMVGNWLWVAVAVLSIFLLLWCFGVHNDTKRGLF